MHVHVRLDLTYMTLYVIFSSSCVPFDPTFTPTLTPHGLDSEPVRNDVTPSNTHTPKRRQRFSQQQATDGCSEDPLQFEEQHFGDGSKAQELPSADDILAAGISAMSQNVVVEGPGAADEQVCKKMKNTPFGTFALYM